MYHTRKENSGTIPKGPILLFIISDIYTVRKKYHFLVYLQSLQRNLDLPVTVGFFSS